MNKIKALMKDKKVVAGIVAAVLIIAGVVIEPVIVEQIVNAITNLNI